MNLAIQHTLLPGDTLAEKFQRAAEYGFTGVELVAWGFDHFMPDHADTIENAVGASGLRVSSLCTKRDDDFVHPEATERTRRLDRLVQMLEFADRLGARGIVGLPIRNPIHLPDLSPIMDEHTLTTQLTVAILQQALERTPGKIAEFFLEPLNRYETWYLRTVGHAAQLCQAIGSPRVTVMADLFHMSIEEAHSDQALSAIQNHIGHVHLADSNRLLPGQGHSDFVAPFRVLKSSGFKGWLSVECGIEGDPTQALPAAANYIRRCWEQA